MFCALTADDHLDYVLLVQLQPAKPTWSLMSQICFILICHLGTVHSVVSAQQQLTIDNFLSPFENVFKRETINHEKKGLRGPLPINRSKIENRKMDKDEE